MITLMDLMQRERKIRIRRRKRRKTVMTRAVIK